MSDTKKKPVFYTEAAYLIGLVITALGVVLLQKSDFGMSMVVAPAYLIHLKVSEFLPFFSFGMSEYCFQGFLVILLLIVVRKPKWSYLFAFVTAVLYGFILDGILFLFQGLTDPSLPIRILLFVLGVPVLSFGIAVVLHTYISQEVYEVFVKEVSETFQFKLTVTKTVFDLSSLLLAVILSFVFFGFGNFVGVGIGTLIMALVNGTIIGFFIKHLDRIFEFKDGLPLRKYFS